MRLAIEVDLKGRRLPLRLGCEKFQDIMAGATFDIFFSGELIGDASPDQVRQRLQQQFKLSDKAAALLFSGRTVTIKHAVDTATATRYREVFRDAGALVQILPIEPPPPEQPFPAAEPAPIPDGTPQGEPYGSEPPEWQMQTPVPAAAPLAEPPFVAAPDIDISYLSLVPGFDWTLEDCQPPPTATRLPDISHLELVMLTPDSSEQPED